MINKPPTVAGKKKTLKLIKKKIPKFPNKSIIFDDNFVAEIKKSLYKSIKEKYPPGTQLEFPFSRDRLKLYD